MSQATQESGSSQPERHRRHTGLRLTLEVGMRMSLDLLTPEGTDEGRRIAAELIGVVHFEFLVLRLPWVPGLRSYLIAGNMVTLRFVSSGDLCGFQAELLSHAVKPALIAFVRYPDVVEKLTLRQHRRVCCALPVQIHSRRGDATGLIADLSRGGCKLVLDVRGQAEIRKMTAGDQLVLCTSFKADGTPQSVSCAVRAVDLETHRSVLGISFSEADPEFWKAIDAFLATCELLG